LGLRSFLSSVQRLITLINRPGPRELWQAVRVCIVGVGVIGLIGFVIKLIASAFQLV